jgi:1-deoxy-D-xylulose-5-phosphate reductoisomerase
LSAANEVAVEAFLAGRVLWSQIPAIIEETLQQHDGVNAHEVDDILEADRAARRAAEKVVAR